MTVRKMNRRTLALRLFAIISVINIVIFVFLVPSQEAVSAPSIPDHHVEMKVKAQLLTSFTPLKKTLLARPGHPPIGAAILAQLDQESVTLWIPEELYRQHHQTLMTEEWSVLPYLDNFVANKRKILGSGYEIAY